MRKQQRTAPIITVLALLISATPSDAQSQHETLAEDTALTTSSGISFTAPKGWSKSVRGPVIVLEAPEGGSYIVVVDVEAEDAESAIAAAWAAYGAPVQELESNEQQPDRNGFTNRWSQNYQTSLGEQRYISAVAGLANDLWTVRIMDLALDVADKRWVQISLVGNSLKARAYSGEDFSGKPAAMLDKDRIADLTSFVEQSMEITGVPGVGLGIVQDGKVVYAGGLGVRELGRPETVDAETMFLVASNTKALTTLMLARLVDAGKITWKTPVTDLLPHFRLGNADTTSRTLVEHLVCACTGLPRKDLPWILEFEGLDAEDSLAELAAVQPTSDFGEIYQYSNNLAAAAGFVGGHVAYPGLDLDTAYDRAMKIEVFDPLGMDSTTFDFDLALSGNFASAHAPNIDGKTVLVPMDWNYSALYGRPAGGAWSNVNDMLKYVQMELDEGLLPDGGRYVSRQNLLERRKPMVRSGNHSHYGMGLDVDRTWGVPVVSHGGDMLGHHSDMMWLPDHGVGLVVLTNADLGGAIYVNIKRKLLEVLFDGEPRALEDVKLAARDYYDWIDGIRKDSDPVPEPNIVDRLADAYQNPELGEFTVDRANGKLVFDFGEFTNEFRTVTAQDGSVSLVTITPGWFGYLEFVFGEGQELVALDAQHRYVFTPLRKEE